MKDGRVIQAGTPQDIYNNANSPFIADFIGITNFIEGIVLTKDQIRCGEFNLKCDASLFQPGQEIRIAIRPESIKVNVEKSQAENVFKAKLEENEFLGSVKRLYLNCAQLGVTQLMVDISSSSNVLKTISIGSQIFITLPADRIRVYAVD